MYLREMGSVELLSREGEIAIAKRIEAGREAMIAGLCESPLTFQAIIIWRDELNEAKIFCATSSISKRPMPARTPRTSPVPRPPYVPPKEEVRSRPRPSVLKSAARRAASQPAGASPAATMTTPTCSRRRISTSRSRRRGRRSRAMTSACRSPPWKRTEAEGARDLRQDRPTLYKSLRKLQDQEVDQGQESLSPSRSAATRSCATKSSRL
jgi:hypothetical protein